MEKTTPRNYYKSPFLVNVSAIGPVFLRLVVNIRSSQHISLSSNTAPKQDKTSDSVELPRGPTEFLCAFLCQKFKSVKWPLGYFRMK